MRFSTPERVDPFSVDVVVGVVDVVVVVVTVADVIVGHTTGIEPTLQKNNPVGFIEAKNHTNNQKKLLFLANVNQTSCLFGWIIKKHFSSVVIQF